MVAFAAFTNDSDEESNSESESEKSELQEAFDNLFEESSSLEKLVTQLRKENKELSIKLSKRVMKPQRMWNCLKLIPTFWMRTLILRKESNNWSLALKTHP